MFKFDTRQRKHALIPVNLKFSLSSAKTLGLCSWWSSGEDVRLQLQQLEFESCSHENIFSYLLFKKTILIEKEPVVDPSKLGRYLGR